MKLNLNLLIVVVLVTSGLNFPNIGHASGAESVPTIGYVTAFEDEFHKLPRLVSSQC